MKQKLAGLLALSHQISREDRRLAILGDGTFLVKSSGCSL